MPERYADLLARLPEDLEWINPGDSAIADPDGKLAAEPVRHREAVLYADVDPAHLHGPRWQLGPATTAARTSSA